MGIFLLALRMGVLLRTNDLAPGLMGDNLLSHFSKRIPGIIPWNPFENSGFFRNPWIRNLPTDGETICSVEK